MGSRAKSIPTTVIPAQAGTHDEPIGHIDLASPIWGERCGTTKADVGARLRGHDVDWGIIQMGSPEAVLFVASARAALKLRSTTVGETPTRHIETIDVQALEDAAKCCSAWWTSTCRHSRAVCSTIASGMSFSGRPVDMASTCWRQARSR